MKYDVCIFGCGRIGYAVAYDLKRLGYKTLAIDVDRDKLDKISKELDVDVETVKPGLENLLEYKDKARLHILALPVDISRSYVEHLIRKGFNLLDVSSIPEDRVPELKKVVSEKGNKVFLYGGVAPGMAQTLAGALYNELDGLDKLEIYVGGLPLDPEDKPLKTNVTWNPLGFLWQYRLTCRKVVDGEVVGLDPLEDVGVISLPSEEEYEYFLSDGLYTLLNTLDDVPNMAEYTLRYKGHLEGIKLLRDLGFLDLEPINIEGCDVMPIKFTARLFDLKLSRDPRDKTLLAVYGYSGDVKAVYLSYTYYDDDSKLTGMQKATGFNASRYAHMLLNGDFEENLMLPEYVGLDDDLFKRYMELIEEAGLKIYRVEERI